MSYIARYKGDSLCCNLSKGGFNTAEEAEQYAESHYCYACKVDLKSSGIVLPCSQEWEIKKEDDRTVGVTGNVLDL